MTGVDVIAKAGPSGLFRWLVLLILAYGLGGGPLRAEPLLLAVASAKATRDAFGLVIDIAVKPEAKAALARFTADNVGQTIDISIDGKVVASARLIEPINGGTFHVSGALDAKGARDIAQRLSKGTARLELTAQPQ